MGIINIDRYNDTNQYISKFNDLFIGYKKNIDNSTAFDFSCRGQLYNFLSAIRFNSTDKTIIQGAQSAQVNDQVYIPNIDIFNHLSVSVDLDIVISSELLRTYESKFQRILYYSINIDYNPLNSSQYAQQYMNILLNIQDNINVSDNSIVISSIGDKYMIQNPPVPIFDISGNVIDLTVALNKDQFYSDINPVKCVIQPRPTSRKTNVNDTMIRQEVDFVFMFIMNDLIIDCQT